MIVIGKVKEVYNNNELPSIMDLLEEKPIDNKEKVLNYLRNPKYQSAVAAGYAKDIFTGQRIPGEFCCCTDGKYGWRSDTIYYFDRYNMALPEEFIMHVLGKIN